MQEMPPLTVTLIERFLASPRLRVQTTARD
jgi:hypothetical protein